MTEIEKMFENAGTKKLLYCDICKAQEHSLGLCAETKCEPFSPPFTAEKQIELIKFLLKNYEGVDINKKNNRFNFLVDNATFIGCHHNDKSFEESLAGVTNDLWQSLTDQEKEEIRRILNENS